MIIQITGASGFVGQNLTQYFTKSPYKITALSLRSENWENDLEQNADVLINLVGKAHDHKKLATEQDFYFANVELTKKIFQAFIKSNIQLLIHVSSIAAIEESNSNRFLDETDESNSTSLYGKSKREAEEWLLEQILPENKKLIIIRPPMVHGTGDKGNLALLYKLISKGIPYPLAAFDNRRSFISIDNFCFFIQEIIKNKDNIPSGIYHIADDEAVSISQIIDIIKSVTGKKVPNIALPKFIIKGIAKLGDFIPIPLNSVRLQKMTGNLLVSNKKIKQALGIEKLPVTATEGLEKTILSFKASSAGS
ncbi:NAD-dependent epimerase/dehydratase family protein [Lonepinella sp. MS14437]|uniref:NAD-dependent epimerase/dehydratase family protein n=1 Tax=Lonepinella sp. MS14437 TaxID=3003620 RepID=UPI0036DA1D0B